jgi:hypothetical protein
LGIQALHAGTAPREWVFEFLFKTASESSVANLGAVFEGVFG